jgi:hypothetical protein
VSPEFVQPLSLPRNVGASEEIRANKKYIGPRMRPQPLERIFLPGGFEWRVSPAQENCGAPGARLPSEPLKRILLPEHVWQCARRESRFDAGSRMPTEPVERI